MPGLALGAHKVVTGLSRSVSISSSSSSSSSDGSATDSCFSLLSSSPASSLSASPPPYAYALPLLDLKFPLSSSSAETTPLPCGSGTVLSSPHARTLYAAPLRPLEQWDRDAVCALLELGEEHGCTGVVLPLRKDEARLGERLHELMYVGGVVIPGAGGDEWVLVGLDV